MNRSGAIPNQLENGAIDDIPFAGSITLRWRPEEIEILERSQADWTWSRGVPAVRVLRLRIHAALVIKVG